MAVLQTVATLALLLSLSQASTLTCDNLLTPLPLENYNTLTGKWVILALGGEKQYELTSSWIELSADDQGKHKTIYWADKLNTGCVPGFSDITQSGSVTSIVFFAKVHKGRYLQTCADCLLYANLADDGSFGSHVFFAKREGSVLSESEKETFRKQTECMNLPEIIYLQAGEADLCPDERAQQ